MSCWTLRRPSVHGVEPKLHHVERVSTRTAAINGRLEALRRNALGFRNLVNYRIRSLLHCEFCHSNSGRAG